MEIFPKIQALLCHFGVRKYRNESFRLFYPIFVLIFICYDVIGLTLFLIGVAKDIREKVFAFALINEMGAIEICYLIIIFTKRNEINSMVNELQAMVDDSKSGFKE